MLDTLRAADADRFNEYFSTVGQRIADTLNSGPGPALEPRLPRVVSGAFRVRPVTLSELSTLALALAPQLRTRAEADLTVMSRWFRHNGLKINASKTEFIIVGTPVNTRKAAELTASFENLQLSPSESIKIWGYVSTQDFPPLEKIFGAPLMPNVSYMIHKIFWNCKWQKIFDANFEHCDLLVGYCQEVLFFRCVEICLGIRGLIINLTGVPSILF